VTSWSVASNARSSSSPVDGSVGVTLQRIYPLGGDDEEIRYEISHVSTLAGELRRVLNGCQRFTGPFDAIDVLVLVELPGIRDSIFLVDFLVILAPSDRVDIDRHRAVIHVLGHFPMGELVVRDVGLVVLEDQIGDDIGVVHAKERSNRKRRHAFRVIDIGIGTHVPEQVAHLTLYDLATGVFWDAPYSLGHVRSERGSDRLSVTLTADIRTSVVPL
jgi:hypothetical protein